MTQYRKKPVVIDAFLNVVTGHTQAFPSWLFKAIVDGDVTPIGDGHALDIHTLEGSMRANEGDWIIRGVKGELYPCKPDIFAATYEEVH